MREDNEKDAYNGGGLKGPLYWLAGVATAMAAKAVAGPGGILGGVLGGPVPPPVGPEAPASREVMELKVENASLRANAHADMLNAGQLVWNATQQGRIDCQQRQIDQLYTLTQLMVPARNVVPPPAVAASTTGATTANG